MPDSEENAPDEQSPLVSPVKPDDEIESEEYRHLAPGRTDGVDQSSKSTWYLILLTLGIGGLQIVWSVELSNGSPYLLSLGMSKALLAFVWVAGPLTGTLVQPYIGIRSDNCRISWGRRKPFMVFGGLATVICLLVLAWIREITSGILGLFGADAKSNGVQITTIVIATILMYCLDFAINTVQAAIRAFIVDCAPAHQQESVNAWAGGLTGAGNILGYILGYMDLPKAFPFLGNTQFKVLCVIASFSLATTLLISCTFIKERDPRLEERSSAGNPNLISFFRQVFRSARMLPPQIRKVCEIQLAAWVGWFPFLFYSTTYIGQLYVNPIFEDHRDFSDDDINKAWEDATRIGAFALLINAIISFASNIILPVLIVPSYKRIRVPADLNNGTPPQDSPPELQRRGSSSGLQEGAASEPLLEGNPAVSNEDEKPSIFTKLQIPGLTLRRTWLISHVLFALCMFTTFFITSYQAGTVVIGIIGISWAITLWAPFALISAEVAQRAAEKQILRLQAEIEPTTRAPELDAMNEADEDIETAPKAPDDSATDQAGIVLGLHNVAISFPQFFSTLVSSLIFKVLQKPRGEPWDDSVGWVMRFGGCAAIIAAYLTKTLEEKGSSPSSRK